MLAHVYLKKGCIVPRHQYENEQITYILEGALHFWIGEDESKEITIRAGEALFIPSTCGTRPKRSKTRWMWTFSSPAGGLARQDRRLFRK